jgi:hypothetical protein
MDEYTFGDSGADYGLSQTTEDPWESAGLAAMQEGEEEVLDERIAREIEEDWRASDDEDMRGKTGENELFTLKHLDKRLNVPKDELVRLAQKGLDYDRVKEKYSQLLGSSGSGGALSREGLAKMKRDADIDDFMGAFPDVAAKDIPRPVWEEVSKGKSLLNAYTMHENSRLRAELEAERQNQKNKASSVSSRLSEGSPERRGEIERLWYEDD